MSRDACLVGPMLGRVLFIAAIFSSAFLIFLVQPIVAKRILPWFGGSAGVWMLCLAFYQSTLFLGYAYAHALTRFASPGLQLGVHAGAVVCALLVLPVLPAESWQPEAGRDPSLRILTMLSANVALPFLVLAATGPLVQAWFARRHPTRTPYPLYAVSNLGSLAGLLLYPFVIEPRFGLSETGVGWSLGFAVASLGVLGCAGMAWRTAEEEPLEASDPGATVPDRPGRPWLWILLPAAAVILLMGVTNELTVDIANLPFLWILPLATYLLTFIVCFSMESSYRRALFVPLALVSTIPSLAASSLADALSPELRVAFLSPPSQIVSYCAFLLFVCQILHGELYRLRPAPQRLTAYYMAISGGGALGGLFVGLVAPRIFDDHHEITVGLGLACMLLLFVCASDPNSRLRRAAPGRGWAVAALASIALAWLAGASLSTIDSGVIHQERSFFGVHRVIDDDSTGVVQRSLWNGTTIHGHQILGEQRRAPTAYYGMATGLGLVMQTRAKGPDKIGVVGLGAGTISTYTRPGGTIRFYEIDPAVIRIARDDGYFYHLADSPAKVEIVEGDARLSLAAEQADGTSQGFDFLVIDAFSSDAIPVHLLTVEAFVHYVAALAPDGLLGVHASSRHFDLLPLIARVAREQGLYDLQIVNARAAHLQSKPSQWIWLSADPARLEALVEPVQERHAALNLEPDALTLRRSTAQDLAQVPVWTDDYSDLFSLLRRRDARP